MCFVLDVNSFPCLFDRGNKEHAEFSPLREWLYNHLRTSLVIGGTAYRKEVDKLGKYYEFLNELGRAGKLCKINNDLVDTEEKRISAIKRHRDFNDAHIIALFCASGCRIFASKDERADPFLKDRNFYGKGQKPPRIYRNHRHKNLLTDANIVKLRNRV